MKIAIAQLNPGICDFEGNLKKIEDAYQRACAEQARLLITSELVVSGYPLCDWIERPEVLEGTEKVLLALAKLTQNQTTALAVGHISVNRNPSGKPFWNTVSVLEKGKVVFQQAKTLLPTYDVFDEARYFEPAETIQLWNCDGHRVAFAICEDLWWEGINVGGRSIYLRDPVQKHQELGAELVISLSASPYEMGKVQRRESIHRQIAQKLKVPVLYCNQVGAVDEILFDGGSFALDSQGGVVTQLPYFENGYGSVEIFSTPSPVTITTTQATSDISVLARGLILGIREYFSRTGFKKAILGLSGGIDSAVIAVLAKEALGSQNLLTVAMPSQFSSSHSLEDAEALARKLNVRCEVKPIKFSYSMLSRELAEGRGVLKPIALENLQSRLRGLYLMTLSNHESGLVLTTGNKSELAMGYCTLYGDMNGALCPLGDLYKTQVYELARHLNATLGSPIPERTLTKAPSAELRPDQKDQDSLPPYEVLDRFLRGYLEENRSLVALEKDLNSDLPATGLNSVRDLAYRVNLNEYKRKQAAPVLKVTSRAFGIGRRIPLAKSVNTV